MDGFKPALTYLSLLFQVIKRKRSSGPSSLSHFYAQGKNTILINIEKTTVSANFMTQSLSGLKCTLASFSSLVIVAGVRQRNRTLRVTDFCLTPKTYQTL